ncbi:hypothetical protein [Nonomuraea cavernae]|uniref:Uncharacterized protein n=1 Tax=Nonomuraea cavernae TaxID=2045107 RepID=A0A917YPP3_9ACTN|nr:hypothetical protein [Nonomuraea cavernae]MCA2183627.1 hypothetical protein [Nonomuraea cavernae]GGO60871.1 hypothetical protein GCM10012289_01760 [Nonomuraea cavernae]
MSDEAAAIAAHAVVLQSDARTLAECVERLRKIEAGLEAGGLAPPWLREAVTAHLGACVAAAADLSVAAAHLHRCAGRVRS